MSSAPPPAASPPLTSTGAAVSAPPPLSSSATSPPPSSTPPPDPSPPAPPAPASTPPSSSPPPPVLASPPPATPSLPPPSLPPPSASPPPPPSLPSPSPPSESPPPPAVPSSSPPPTNPPPSSRSPPPPSIPSPPPPSIPSPSPPSSSPPPPPSAQPPSPPSSSPPPPSDPSTPPAPSLPVPAPNNTSSGTTPAKPRAPSSLPSPAAIDPVTPSSNKSTDASSSGSSGGDNSGGGALAAGPAIAVALVVSLLVLSVVGLAVWFVRKRRRPVVRYEAGFVMPSPYSSSVKSESSYPRSPSAPLVNYKSGSIASDAGMVSAKSGFSYEELYEITDGFSPQNILGGGFGCVFKGQLQDGREVAIKQLKSGSGQGEREFKAEVEIISRVHHRHLVSLVGYCISESHRLLVYDFVPNGTLESHLHGKGNPVMNWGTRVKVAAGAARGLAYLHEDCHPRIIHRDIKSSNILLDNSFEAQVSDFGLARLAMDAATHVTTRVMGTFGYMAPEYASSGKLTEKSDVFSFGVVLLELITGRKPVDSTRPLGDESLVEWARPLLTAALESQVFGQLPDPRLGDNYDKAEMFCMIEAAAACTRHSASMRPRMGKVARVLDGLADIDLNNGVTPGQSALFNQAQTADIRLFQRMAFGSQDFSSDYSQSNWSRQTDL